MISCLEELVYMHIRDLQSEIFDISEIDIERVRSTTYRRKYLGETNQQISWCLYQDMNLVVDGTI
jgi:hypothetical protein